MAVWHAQAVRFLLVGLASNIFLFVLYLALTEFGVGHIGSMTGLYFLGVMQTFVLNKRITFTHSGAAQRSFQRYLAIYFVCYVLNLGAMVLFVDLLGFRHQIVQGVAILVIAAILFLLQKFWVFAPCRMPNAESGGGAGRV